MQLKSAEHMAKNQFQMHILRFFFHADFKNAEFLKTQFHSEKLSFVHKKESEHCFGLSLSICVLYFQS